MTTVETITPVLEHALRGLKSDSEEELKPGARKLESNAQITEPVSRTLATDSFEDTTVKREMEVELTTSFMVNSYIFY